MKGCACPSVQQTEWYKKRSRFRSAAVTLNSHVFFIRVTSPAPDIWITHYYQTIDTQYALKYIDAFICVLFQHHSTHVVHTEGTYNKINENSPLYCCYARSGASSSRIFADSIGEKKTSEVKIVQQEMLLHFTNFFDFVKSFIYCIIYWFI